VTGAEVSKIDVKVLFELLRLQATLDQVSNFLKEKGLEHSAPSWEEMINRRLKPYLHDKSLRAEDLLLLLREVEEHGSQHVLLYRLGRKESFGNLFNENELEKRLVGAVGWPKVGEASFVNLPEKPTIVEVRRDKKGQHTSIIVKFVEKRIHTRRKGTEQDKGDLIVRYSQEIYRAVNVVRISEDGVAEVRVFSHKEAVSYEGEAFGLLQRLAPLVPIAKWESLPLNKLRNNLLDPKKRNEMKKHFKLRHTQQRDENGNRLQAAVGTLSSDIYEAQGLIGSLDLFGQAKNASHCDRAAVYLQPARSNEREIAVVLHGDTNGQPNEFSIGSRVNQHEYEHILGSIIKYNE
jgi:hypothetical protein